MKINQDLLVVGDNVAGTFMEIDFLKCACFAQAQVLSGGRPLHIPSEEVQRHTAAQFDSQEEKDITQLAWQAALRLIEAQNDDYCC